ncbi:MAG: type I-E CRISPR-associated protein Cas7/Cse4/CasC, partial [Pseudomonadota bacterium]
MSRFVQLHALTAYPPSNPNRDDLGRPKTAIYGGHPRLRISSQSLKRAFRQSEAFQMGLAGSLGERTQRLGEQVEEHLTSKGTDEERAMEIARQVASAFGKIKGEKDAHPARIEQLAFVSPDEKALAMELADAIAGGEEAPKEKDLANRLLRNADGAADIAMFGRMLAADPDYNRDAAVQVAHAITTSRVDVEDDFYTAVDDLKTPAEDAGAGFIGEAGFGAGVFYLYVCVDRALLLENLSHDAGLAAKALQALVHAIAVNSPSGKKSSFANHVRAEYLLAERGDYQPRTLASAFLNPVGAGDQLALSKKALTELREQFNRAYGADWDADIALDVREGGASLDEVAAF